ncbi:MULTISPECIES: IclR family transcriptional regulator C-terminal domain-containing protein [Nocardiaceae]|uniref:IclR family transcriptional regulator C-terminal domain-containing protein n=1 Tax=Nocardiaceae TaxID=85025 RepID=UPI001E3E90F4|nr:MULTISPECIES: IclR family transcriptional regulator C-terminal domain-containing protein [Rhodococcus]
MQEEALSRPLRRYTPRSITDPKVLARELDSIRRTGIAIEREEAAMGGCCVASPVLLAGEPIAALSVSVPKDRFAPELLAPAVRTAALALGRVLARSSTGQSEG